MAGVFLVLATALAAGFWAYSYDDAFVTYRYANNVAKSGVLEYNPGERVLGTTAPGWALVLGGLTKISAGVIEVAGWGTILSLASLLVVTLTLARGLARSPALYRWGVPLGFAVLAPTLRWNLEMFGAETLAVTALVPLGVLAALTGRGAAGGALLAAAASCRLDAALAAVVLLPVLAAIDRRAALRCGLTFALPVAIFVAGLELRFGAVVPNTLDAKQSEVSAALPAYGTQEWRWLRRTLPTPSSAAGMLALALLGAGRAGGALSRGVRTRGTRAWLREHPEATAAAVMALWLAGHELAYRVLAVPFAPWYHVPAVNGLLVLAIAGALFLASVLARLLPEHPRPLAASLMAAALLLALFQPWSYVTRYWGRAPDPRYDAFRQVAEHLAREAPPGATVAVLEIGVIGAFAPDLRILDLGGLVSPEVLAARRDGTLPDLVAGKRPDYLVDSTQFPTVFGPLLAHPEITAGYREGLRIPDGRGHELRVLARRPAP